MSEFRPFNEVFPAGNIHHHFSAGVYAKELHIPAGYRLVSHKHAYDHLSILASGSVAVTVDGVRHLHEGPAVLTIRAGENHEVHALTDAIWFCIHPTDETDPDKVDEAAIMKESA